MLEFFGSLVAIVIPIFVISPRPAHCCQPTGSLSKLAKSKDANRQALLKQLVGMFKGYFYCAVDIC
jgi:hypothetical protein